MIATASSTTNWTKLGVYTPDQAARLLGIREGMVKRWIYGSAAGGAALIPQYPNHQGDLVTFVDLVQAMAVRQIRQSKALSLQKIRATIEAADKHGVNYPFARKHTTYVFHDDVVLRLNSGNLIQVTGKYKEQHLLEPIVQNYLDDMGFDDDGLVDEYVPMQQGFRKVVLKPTVNFGAPTVFPCGYTVRTLLDALDAEGSVESAANVCDVHHEDVRVAAAYENTLRNAA